MEPLRYHDFDLRGYSVSDFGTRIAFDLVYDAPDSDTYESRITFSDVACYSFLHPSGATIAELDEVDVATLVAEENAFFTDNARQHGLRHWQSTIDDYVRTLQREQLRAWRIASAVGFDGFVIARRVEGRCTTVATRPT